MDGRSNRTIQWSPCSQFLSINIPELGVGDTISVMNTSLEELYCSPAFPHQPNIQTAWSADCTFVGAQCSGSGSGRDFLSEHDWSYGLDVCWHPSEPDPATGAAATHAKALLAGLGARETVVRLAWGCSNAFAAVVQTPQAHHRGEFRAKQCKLYVLLPKRELASMMLPENFDFYSTLRFSTTGHHLLVECGRYHENLQLVTTSCQVVKSFSQHTGTFHPGGQLLCCIGDHSLKLIRSADGRQTFSMACSNLGSRRLRLYSLGSQLMLDSRIVLFGLGTATTAEGRQLCQAINTSCSWVSSRMRDIIEWSRY